MGAALDETDGAVQDTATSGPAKSRFALTRLRVIVGAVVVVAILLVAALCLFGILPTPWHRHAENRSIAHAERPSYVDVPDIIANLDTGGHRSVFVKLRARIEVAHVSDQALVAAEMPRILDTFQTYLRSTRPEEIHGGEGTYRLREALINRIDVLIAPAEIQDVLFVEMLVQ